MVVAVVVIPSAAQICFHLFHFVVIVPSAVLLLVLIRSSTPVVKSDSLFSAKSTIERHMPVLVRMLLSLLLRPLLVLLFPSPDNAP